MKPKTYKGKLTKREVEKFKRKITLIILLSFVMVFGSYLQTQVYLFPSSHSDVAIKVAHSSTQKNKTKKGSSTPKEKEKKHTKPHKAEVKKRIKEVAREMGRSEWSDYLIKLAHCESRFKPKRINDRGNEPEWSIDRGVFQFNSYWQRGVSDECAFNVECATRETIKKIEKGDQHLWACDDLVKGVPKEVVLNR